MRDARVDELIRKSLRAISRRNPGVCADENHIAAYLEGSLTQGERREFESHMVDCATCQELLALCLKLQSEENGDFLPETPAPLKKMLFRFSIPVPAIGVLLICVAIGAVLIRWQHKTQNGTHENSSPVEQVADLSSHPQPFSGQPAQAAKESKEPKTTRTGPTVAEKRSRLATAESKLISPPAPQAAPRPPYDGLESIAVSSSVGMLQKKDAPENMVSTDAATNTPQVPPELNRPSAPAAIRDEMAALTSPASISQSETALPAGAVLGAGNDSQVQAAKGKAVGSTPGPPADAIVLARTQEPFARPHLYAAQNRIATSMYETESVASSLRFAIKNLGSNLKTAESRKIGDRTFYKHLGYWIDAQSKDHPDSPIMEIPPEDPQYKTIVEKYPDLRSLLPASVFWEEKNCLLK